MMTLAAVTLTSVLVSCGEADPPRASSATTGPPLAASTSSTGAATTTTLPPSTDFVASAGEINPQAKEAAADVVVAAATYPLGGGTEQAARTRLEAIGADPELARSLGALLHPDAAASAQIVYPQLGGLTADSAAIILVMRQWVADDQRTQMLSRTIDLRSSLVGGRWIITEITSGGGSPPPDPPPLSDAARAVLDSSALDLSDTTRWDIESGRIDDRVLSALLEASATVRLSVTVLTEGHSVQVFGTTMTSNHAGGRAVDIWAVDDVPVIASRDQGSAAYVLSQRLIQGTVDEFGSPWDFDGAASSRSFTNDVHQDHLHVAFDQ